MLNVRFFIGVHLGEFGLQTVKTKRQKATLMKKYESIRFKIKQILTVFIFERNRY